MNVDSFKARLIAATGAKGLSWKEYDEYKGEGAHIYSEISLPNFDEVLLLLFLYKDSMEVIFKLDAVRENEDTLRLVNDFNQNTTYFKAFIQRERNRNILYVACNVIHLPNEEAGVNAFMDIMNTINSDSVNTYLRPLTIIAKP